MVPQVEWDEGWTLNVASNWVELGHYGQLLNGQPRSPGLSAALPVVAPVALSFRIFGVGVWQGRLPSIFFLFGSLLLIFWLAERLYNRSIAIGTLVVLLFLSGIGALHPLPLGRMVSGEMPMVFFLLTGYTLFLISLKKSGWIIIPAALFWGIAIKSKAQPLPFWLISLFIPLLISLFMRWRKSAFIIISGILLSLMVYQGLMILEISLVPEVLREAALSGLTQSLAVVLTPGLRLSAIRTVLFYGLPTLFGLIYTTWIMINRISARNLNPDVGLVRLAILSLTGSWFAWYISLSIGFTRYLFPVTFIGSIFTSNLIYELTQKFQIQLTIRSAALFFRKNRGRKNLSALLALILIAINGSLAIDHLFKLYTYSAQPISEVTQYIQSVSNEDDLIETYESELLFLLNRRYHYPPDITNVEVIKRNHFKEEIPYTYDPLEEVNPDFLIIGYFGEFSQIYNGVLASGRFEKIKSFLNYSIYARVNE